MSESSYTGKERKRMKHSDVQQEDEEKAKDVSKEGNASSSKTPTETTATDAKPSGEGNADLPFQKPADSPMTQGHADGTHNGVISESKWGQLLVLHTKKTEP